jgi:hypothetical protein
LLYCLIYYYAITTRQVPVRSTLASNMACSHHGKLRTREAGLTRSQRLHMLLDAQFYDSDGQLDYHKVGLLHSATPLSFLFFFFAVLVLLTDAQSRTHVFTCVICTTSATHSNTDGQCDFLSVLLCTHLPLRFSNCCHVSSNCKHTNSCAIEIGCALSRRARPWQA